MFNIGILFRAAAVLLFAGLTVTITADSEKMNVDARTHQWAAEVKSQRHAAVEWNVTPLTSCYAGTIGCNQTRTGRVSLDSCESDDIYAVGYSFSGTAGRQVRFSAKSDEFAMTIIIGDGRPGMPSTILARHDVYVTGQTAAVTLTLPFTGDYLVMVTPLQRNRFGDYTLTASCETTPPPPPPPTCSACVPNATTACLLENRFKVTVSWYDAYLKAGGVGKPVRFAENKPEVSAEHGAIMETAFFAFFDFFPNTAEMMVKMTKGVGINDKYWIYLGGLTGAEYTVNIQDTRTCQNWSRLQPASSTTVIRDQAAFPFP
jgi:hypothetical protein